MQIAQKTSETTFDVIGIQETQASVVRNKTLIRLSFVNEHGQLERYTKSTTQTLNKGSLLTSSDSHLKGTGDRKNATAILLVPFDTDAETKLIDGKVAKYLPVSLL